MDPLPPFVAGLALASGSGVHLAIVVSLEDPQSMSRVQVRLPGVDHHADQDAPLWARVCTPFAGDQRGAFWMPDVDDEVLVAFVNGDARFPIVLGGLWNARSPAPETLDRQNNLKVVRSRNGVKITLDDTQGQERLKLETPGGQIVELKDGPNKIVVRDANGGSTTFESSGITLVTSAKLTINASTIEVSAGTITVDCAFSSFSGVVRCDTLIANSVVSTSYTPGAGNIW